jgi:hypothetical protein
VSYPKKQYLLARVRGRTTNYFYGTKLGELVTDHIKVGDDFWYTILTRGAWTLGTRTSRRTYGTAA